MEVQEIIGEKEKFTQFLRDKGFKEEKDYIDLEYVDGSYFEISERRLLVVYEIVDEEKLKEIKNHFLIDRGLSYCVIFFNHKLLFFRNFGETKYFIYSERTKNNPSKIDKLSNIKESFDSLFQSKDISSQFYESFKLKRNLLVQHIKNDVEPTQKYLIAQKIFDRFFFTYFLCHKGIIKFNDGGKISGENLFSRILLNDGDFLLNLKKLFHLFNSREKDTLEIGGYEIIIPYLNGGLFRPDVLEEKLDISLKNKQWGGIFDFLNSYHWIIEDVKASEEDEDRILTPEILGHVYERSVVEWEREGFEEEAEKAVKQVTERKKKGVYYTPESITDYISNNTIIPYLLDRLENKYENLDELIESGSREEYKKALEILDEIKVLDPACGSGAFLIKASEVIYFLRRRLLHELGDKENFYNLKLDIITENIYGVDILMGAIEISKLRLWLWLISDFEESKNEIQALPNIEYNLKVGNSLVGWLDEELVQISLNTPLTDEVKGILRGLRVAFKNTQRSDIDKAKQYLDGYKLNDYIEAYYLLYRIYRTAHGDEAEDLRKILETIRDSIYSTVTPAFLQFVNSKIKPGYDSKKPPITKEEFEKFQVFHWRIDFGHIILKGGFDVVIGNPPYLRVQTTSQKEKTILKSTYVSTKGKFDYYVVFIEKSLKLLIDDGFFSFIIPNKFTQTKYGAKLKEYILKDFEIKEFTDFGDIKVFEGVTTYPSILVIQKATPERNKIKYTRVLELVDKIEPHTNKSKIKSFSVNQEDLDCEHWYFLPHDVLTIYNKISNSTKQTLGNLSERIYEGFISGANSVFFLNRAEIEQGGIEKKLIHPVPKGKKVRRYHISWNNEYIVYPYTQENNRFKKVKLSDFPNTKLHLEKNKARLLKRKYVIKSGKDWFELWNTRKPDWFNQQKIITPNLSKESNFALDQANNPDGKYFFIDHDCYGIILKNKSKNNYYFILGLLNSKLIDFFIKQKSPMFSGGYYKYHTQYLEIVPIVNLKETDYSVFVTYVAKILSITKSEDYSDNKKKQEEVRKIQDEIDQVVYKLYGLAKEEIEIIERYASKGA